MAIIINELASATELPDEFWNARPALTKIRTAAHSRNRSAAAVLQVVLARLAAGFPHTIELPPIVGAAANLSYMAVLLAPPGVGKSSGYRIGADLVRLDAGVVDDLPLGSGEGLVEVLFDWVFERDENGKRVKVKRQTHFNAFVYVDEGLALAEIGRRSGSTLLGTMRSIWSGSAIGNTNASVERRRIVPPGQYAYGIIVGLQASKADVLLDDVDAGTPQRFVWAFATDPTIPDVAPEWPGQLEWKRTAGGELDTIRIMNAAGYVRHQLAVAEPIQQELHDADLDRARRATEIDPLDAHAGLVQLKIAGLLALLDSRLGISVQDWRLAQIVKASSDAVRDEVVALIARDAIRREHHTQRRVAARAVEADVAVRQRRIVDAARKLAAKVHEDPERWTRMTLYRAMRRQRDDFEDALDHAKAEGWVVEVAEPSRTGSDRRLLRPGITRPS
jgi:hypothetical protein